MGELHRGPAEPHRRARAHDRARHGREALHAERRGRGPVRAAARLAPRGAALRGRRAADVGLALRLRPLLPPQPRAERALLLPAEARVTHGGAALERRLRLDAGAARGRARDDQGDRPDRDDPRRLRDGRDPPRAARPLRGAQRRPVGLHLQRHQEARPPPRVRASRPGGRDHGRPLHALLLRAPRQDVPPARGPRDGRDGGVHPLPPRRRGERGRPREGARGQGPRGVAGLRRDVGGAPRSRPGGDGVVRPGARRQAEPDRPAARRRGDPLRGSPGRRGHARRDHRGRAPQQRLGRDPVPRRVAAGRRRGRDQQPHGGRGDGGDLPFADLAMAPPRSRHPRRRAADHRGGDRRASATATATRERCSSASRHSATTSSSSRCPRTTGCSRSSRPDRPQGRSDAQGSSAATSTAA